MKSRDEKKIMEDAAKKMEEVDKMRIKAFSDELQKLSEKHKIAIVPKLDGSEDGIKPVLKAVIIEDEK